MAGHERILQEYLKPDLLIVDDMGMKQLPKRSGEYLFEIIMRRHELRSTMMTSNRPLEEWGKLIGDVPASTAILDRFLQQAEVVQIAGRSYRLEKAKKTSKVPKRPPAPMPKKHKPKSTSSQGCSINNRNWYLLKRLRLVPFEAPPDMPIRRMLDNENPWPRISMIRIGGMLTSLPSRVFCSDFCVPESARVGTTCTLSFARP